MSGMGLSRVQIPGTGRYLKMDAQCCSGLTSMVVIAIQTFRYGKMDRSRQSQNRPNVLRIPYGAKLLHNPGLNKVVSMVAFLLAHP